MKTLGVLFLSLFFTVLATAEDAKALLTQIDAQRYLPDMSFTLQLTAYQGDQVRDSTTMLGFIRSKDEQNSTLLWFSSPSNQKGRKMLMDGNTVYLLFPKTRNPIRLTPLQVLTGEASNGDVARTSFDLEYDPTGLEEVVKDGKTSWLFHLEVKESHKGSTYRKINLWVEKATLEPYFGEFFTTGEKPLKTIQYKNYKKVDGKMIPFLMDIRDGENTDKHTEMNYLKIGSKKLPDTVFRREYLESWTPAEE